MSKRWGEWGGTKWKRKVKGKGRGELLGKGKIQGFKVAGLGGETIFRDENVSRTGETLKEEVRIYLIGWEREGRGEWRL